MTAALYHKKLARVLDRMGGVYLVSDILDAIAANRMQSFVEGESWMITQIFNYPRGRALEIFLMTGDLKDCLTLFDRAARFAEEKGIGLMIGSGRRGWRPHLQSKGWKVKTTSYVYHKEL